MSNLSPHPTPQRSFIPNAPTMTSREIADLAEKRHDNVMRDIRVMIKELHGEGGLLKFEETHIDPQNKRTYPIFRLPKRETLILVSGYSTTLRARIIDRWQELEKQAALATFNIPETLHGALQLAANLAKDKAEAEQALALAAPKAAFHDAVTEAVNCQTVQEVAKVLGTGPNRLFKFMRDEGMLLDNNLPYQSHIDAGHFKVVERCRHDHRGEGHTYTRTLVTGKGLAYIQKKLRSPLPLLRAA